MGQSWVSPDFPCPSEGIFNYYQHSDFPWEQPVLAVNTSQGQCVWVGKAGTLANAIMESIEGQIDLKYS